MDSIIAKGLSYTACHGVLPEEKANPQLFKVDLELFLGLHSAGKQDNLALSVDYNQVYHLVAEVMTGPPCNLLEALAEKIADCLLEKFPIAEVEVIVYKPDAPVEGEFDYFAVKIRRKP